MATVHIIGAGISGLCAATALATQGVPVKLYEASTAAGGRCRSSHDGNLGMVDHGLHLFSGAARELQRFIARIDACDHFQRVPMPLPIIDGKSGARWTFSRHAPLPAAPLGDLAMLASALLRPDGASLDRILPEHSPLQDAMLVPLSRMALQQAAHRASAKQLQRLLRRQLRKGGFSFFMPRASLQESLIAPALHVIEYHGGSVYFGQALKRVEFGTEGPRQLHFSHKKLSLQENDVLILATPSQVTQHFIPTLATPRESHSAITLHLRTPHRERVGSVAFLTNAVADMLRYDEGIIRASIRVADHAWHSDESLLAARLWRCLQTIHPYLRGATVPEWAIWREKRAGHIPGDTPLPAHTLPPRCVLAGDWLNSTRPATLEAAAASGHAASDAALELLGKFPQPSQYDFYLN